MRKIMNRLIVSACLILILMGCNSKSQQPPATPEEWREGLTLKWGVMETEPLGPLHWSADRCAVTSNYAVAETEEGYYVNTESNRLIYADKTNLGLWVPVCNKPNCPHTSMYMWSQGQIVCNAETLSGSIFFKDGRLWFAENIRDTEMAIENASFAIVSVAPDGTDKRVEMTDKEIVDNMHFQSMVSERLFPDQWIYATDELLPDGSEVCHAYRYTNGVWQKLASAPNETKYSGGLDGLEDLYGDLIIRVFLGGNVTYIRFPEEGYELLDMAQLPTTGYVCGDILRCYKPNDGYYDMNISSREEVKLCDARMENGFAQMLLPNCIVESTMLTRHSFDQRTAGMTHSLEIFDGQQWHTVALPKELQNNDTMYLLVQAVTSDSILFLCQDEESIYNIRGTTDLYRIDLTKDTWELEFIAQVNEKFVA